MAQPKLPHLETPAEEVASSITHGVGALLASAALSILVVYASLHGSPRRIVSVSIYGATLLFMYVASTCYHLVRKPTTKRTWRIFDHASIYLLIAGTYTPVTLVMLPSGWGWSLFGVVWGLAVVGVGIKIFFVERWEGLSTLLYVMMGWLAIIAIKPLLAGVPMSGLMWLLSGGLAYTAGVVFFLWDHLPFNHAIWHLFVIAGSVCHFFAVFLYVIPVGR